MKYMNWSQDECKAYLKEIGYGNKRDFPKIYVNGLATNWAKSLTVAKVAWKAQYNEWPYSVEYA